MSESNIKLLTVLGIIQKPATQTDTICSCCGSRKAYKYNEGYTFKRMGYGAMPIEAPEMMLVSHWDDAGLLSSYLASPMKNMERFVIPDDQHDALIEWRNV